MGDTNGTAGDVSLPSLSEYMTEGRRLAIQLGAVSAQPRWPSRATNRVGGEETGDE